MQLASQRMNPIFGVTTFNIQPQLPLGIIRPSTPGITMG